MKRINPALMKMSPQERAKQFMPFAALKGYEEALRKKEEEAEARALKKNEPFYEDLPETTFEATDIP